MTFIKEGGEYRGESGKVYLAVSALGQDNVWTSVERDNNANIVVLKAPAPDDTEPGWPKFQHEMIMHELLKDCPSVRKQVDRIPPTSPNTSPILVLEIFQTTLWHARTKRPFSKEEVRSVTRQILQGLKAVHDHGLVYADLKMQNVMLSGFDTTNPGNGTDLKVKLGDLGIVMQPARGTVQPVAYRAPEVFFKGEITPKVDMWAFGLVYCHLMEAINHFDMTGLYDDLYVGSGTMHEREQAMRHAIGNDYDLQSKEYYQQCALPYRDESHPAGQQWHELRNRGLDEDDIAFLQFVLAADPTRRPSANQVLDTHFLDKDTPHDSDGPHEQNGAAAAMQDSHGHLTTDLPQANGAAAGQTSTGNSVGSGTRARRDGQSVSIDAPEYFAQRPQAMPRGESQAMYTPFTPAASSGQVSPFGAPGAGQISPLAAISETTDPEPATGGIVAHRLVRSAQQAGLEESESLEHTRLKIAGDTDSGAEKETNSAPDPAKIGSLTAQNGTHSVITNSHVEHNEVPTPQDSAATTPASTAERPAHISANSSSGGTFLSYR
ncbi:hypothetical protein LTR62_005024 [Meristemomyces frigidus]|uniref:Protein kinase domain-containing protein n=1 Tax=Meristemomyces frigidus TaxID=1508187 RepID=A0AAN7YMY7_9PEZI|nr:hypothetical protein LTR62_005024 [Meristemomyces frigidus]